MRSSLFLAYGLLAALAVFAGPNAKQAPHADSHPDASLVMVPVTVTDSLVRFITGLDPTAFHLSEDKIPQNVSFGNRELPLSVGIVLDTSGSMAGKLDRVPVAANEFLNIALIDPADEALLIEFNDRPALVQGFTHDRDAIANSLLNVDAKGKSALFDAVYLGLTEMEKAKNPRKALIVISDGVNHGGVYSESEIAELSKKSGVAIYCIGLQESANSQRDGQREVSLSGDATLRRLSEPTGGRTFEMDNPGQLPDVAAKIGLDLRDQYLLAYTPSNQAHDGRFRKITVKVDATPDAPSAHAFFMSGYYAPSH